MPHTASVRRALAEYLLEHPDAELRRRLSVLRLTPFPPGSRALDADEEWHRIGPRFPDLRALCLRNEPRHARVHIRSFEGEPRRPASDHQWPGGSGLTLRRDPGPRSSSVHLRTHRRGGASGPGPSWLTTDNAPCRVAVRPIATGQPFAASPDPSRTTRPKLPAPCRYPIFPKPESVFVITAYEMTGKTLAAYRRRLRRKGR